VFFDPSQALSSRLLFVAYERSFAGKEDEDLKAKLLTEVEGINVWALEGLRRLKATGKFTVPATHLKLLGQFSSTAAPIARFVEDCLWVHRSLDPGDLPDHCLTDQPVSIARTLCFQAYQEWAGQHDMSVSDDGIAYFGRDLRAVLTKLKPYSKRRKGGFQQNVYDGIGLRKPVEESYAEALDMDKLSVP
jgi:putative DNA primase/helicase